MTENAESLRARVDKNKVKTRKLHIFRKKSTENFHIPLKNSIFAVRNQKLNKIVQ
jgi:hypothetical protein